MRADCYACSAFQFLFISLLKHDSSFITKQSSHIQLQYLIEFFKYICTVVKYMQKVKRNQKVDS